MKTLLILLLFLLSATLGAQTNEGGAALPGIFRLNSLGSEYQGWNNCGPATLTNALVHFGYEDDQFRAATWLKPNYEDKNVSPWQMAEFVNTQIPELPVYAIVRSGGTLEQLQTLMVNEFPVVIEKGYEPSGYDWMGHYLLLTGWDESLQQVNSMDSFKGPNTRYSYDDIERYWQHFNYKYIVLYTVDQEEELMALLGDDADEWQNHIKALEMARAEAIEDQDDAHAWFNMGSNFVSLGMYDAAAQAYDKAISLGLPWRMFWYQFGSFEAYYQTERYDDMIRIARQNQNDGGGQYVEETYYYLGMAREGRGETGQGAAELHRRANLQPQFHPGARGAGSPAGRKQLKPLLRCIPAGGFRRLLLVSQLSLPALADVRASHHVAHKDQQGRESHHDGEMPVNRTVLAESRWPNFQNGSQPKHNACDERDGQHGEAIEGGSTNLAENDDGHKQHRND